MSSSETMGLEPSPRGGARPGTCWYNAVWRWHFYAGLFCIPFVVWLAVTGTIYLWRPQIEAWLERPYDQLAGDGPAGAPEAQVTAALAAVPGATLSKYILPRDEHRATRILVSRAGETMRVWVDPRSLAVLGVAVEEQRPMRLVFHLHGELLAGAVGSYLVETAACWAIVMILTGLYLWWPRGRGPAGVLYPRLRGGSRILWRDIHACAGVWISVLALGLILTGLPWAKDWGGYLTEMRALTGTSRGPVDWPIGDKPPQQDPMIGDHFGHAGMGLPTRPVRAGELTRVIAAVAPFGIAPPVTIAPPRRAGAPWSVASDAADRPLREDVEVDGATGAILGRTQFAQRHWIDRAIGYGVAAHEGALFGLANQLLGTATTISLVVLALSGAVMWWRRRPAGLLGAPIPRARPRFGGALVALVLALAAYMPLFGATLILVLLVERLVLRRLPRARRWLGLALPA